MLNETMISKLNHQINLEHYSANLYLAMSAWCAHKGFEGAARFLKQHSEEEMAHARKLFDYVNETGSLALIKAIDAPPSSFDSLKEVFEKTLAHEKSITEAINALVDNALAQKDYSTFNFLQWYVSEQHEEEHLFMSILDLFGIVEPNGRNLLMIDREIGARA